MTEEADRIYEGLGAIFRAGAREARRWPYNNQALVQAAVYDAMADEAERQAEMCRARHD